MKSVWHGSGLSWEPAGGGGPAASSPPGTCSGWHSESSLEVGFANAIGDPSSSLLTPQRFDFQCPNHYLINSSVLDT